MSGFDPNAKMFQKPIENEFGKLVQKNKKEFLSLPSLPHFRPAGHFPAGPACSGRAGPLAFPFPLLLFFFLGWPSSGGTTAAAPLPPSLYR